VIEPRAWKASPPSWPIFPILGWGIGVAANAWDVYGRKPITEEEIRREADRLRG
jgi:2TM domain